MQGLPLGSLEQTPSLWEGRRGTVTGDVEKRKGCLQAREGRAATARRAGEGDWLGHHWSPEWPRATAQTLPRGAGCWGKQMWEGARLPACWAGAQSQSRLVGHSGHTSAAEVLTCRDEGASICYLSGEFLIPLQWITRRCFSSQVNPPLRDPGRSPRLQSPLSIFRAPGGQSRMLPGHLDLGGCVPTSLLAGGV